MFCFEWTLPSHPLTWENPSGWLINKRLTFFGEEDFRAKGNLRGCTFRKEICLTRMHVCWVASVMSHSLQPMDCSPPGSSLHGILQARILEWVAMPTFQAWGLTLKWRKSVNPCPPDPKLAPWSQGSQSAVLITKWHKHLGACLSQKAPFFSDNTIKLFRDETAKTEPGDRAPLGTVNGPFFNPSWQQAAVYLEEPIVSGHSHDFLAQLKVPAQLLPNYQLLVLLPPLRARGSETQFIGYGPSVLGKPLHEAQYGHKVKYARKPVFKGFRI